MILYFQLHLLSYNPLVRTGNFEGKNHIFIPLNTHLEQYKATWNHRIVVADIT